MDFQDEMLLITNYLENGTYPEGHDKARKNWLRRRSHDFGLGEHPGVLIYRETREVIRTKNEQSALIAEIHGLGGAHFGRDKTTEKLTKRFYWKGMTDDVRNFLLTCHQCQQTNTTFKKPHSSLHPIPVTGLWKQIGVDVVGPLPVTPRGNRYIVTLCDFFSKWPEAEAVPDKKATTIGSFLKKVMMRLGCVEVLITDQGREFVNNLNSRLMADMGIDHRIASAYHPQTNGLVERFNRTLQDALKKVVCQDGSDWDTHLDDILFAYRASKHSSTGVSPFMVMYGREPKLPVDFRVDVPAEAVPPPPPSSESISSHMESAKSNAEARGANLLENIKRSQARQKKHYDKRFGQKVYQVGDHVMMANARKRGRKGGKMEHAWSGPYEVTAVFPDGTCELQNILTGCQLKKKINSVFLKHYYERTEQANSSRASRDPNVDEEEPSADTNPTAGDPPRENTAHRNTATGNTGTTTDPNVDEEEPSADTNPTAGDPPKENTAHRNTATGNMGTTTDPNVDEEEPSADTNPTAGDPPKENTAHRNTATGNMGTTTGIPNIGNTCFVYAAVQLLKKSGLIQRYGQMKGIHSIPAVDSIAQIINSLEEDFCERTRLECVSSILSLFPDLADGQQHDSLEFFQAIAASTCHRCGGRCTFLSSCFILETKNKLHCSSCSHEWHQGGECRFSVLPLYPLWMDCSVADCLNDFFEWEDVEDVECRVCKSRGTVQLFPEPMVTPDILVVQIVRWIGNQPGEMKDHTNVRVSEGVTVANTKYEVEALLCHECSMMNQGHYKALYKEGWDDWVMARDSSISHVNGREALHGQGVNVCGVLYQKVPQSPERPTDSGDEDREDLGHPSTTKSVDPNKLNQPEKSAEPSGSQQEDNPPVSSDDVNWENFSESFQERYRAKKKGNCKICAKEYTLNEGFTMDSDGTIRFYSEDSGFCSWECEVLDTNM